MVSAPLDEFRLLQTLRKTPRLFELLEQDGPGDNVRHEMSLQKQLRRDFPEPLVRAALTLHDLRKRAAGKFSRASEMWLDRVGLEQATAEVVARYKARRFASVSGRIRDYCSGIGGDAIALAEQGTVIAVDRHPASCLRGIWNAALYGVSQHVHSLCADVTQLPFHAADFLHIDPDRRAGRSGRSVRLEQMVPGLDFLQECTQRFQGGAIKLSPASNFGGKFPGTEIELISVDGECKEATVWFGELAGRTEWRATVLPGEETITGDPLSVWSEVEPLGNYLYDPDPAVVRAGLIDVLAETLGLKRLDEAEEYLTSDELIDSPFVRPFAVLAELSNNDREIRRYFRQSDFGQIEIKCRHVPVQADAVRRKLPLPGDRPGVLIFARIEGKTRAVAARRVPDGL